MNDHPVILVPGLLGWGPDELFGLPYWGVAQKLNTTLRKFVAMLGPVSSSHDRACELAYQIKGGRVDFGSAHARTEGHSQFGRTYSTPFHPQWSESNPVHLVGHSMGAPTIWLLQHLLASDFFGWGSNANWVKSLTSISGVLNGSTATYFFGADERTGLLHDFSIGHFLSSAIELQVRVAGDLFDRLYDFQLDQWGIDSGQPLDRLMAQLARSPMFRGRDHGAYSLTIQALLEQNAVCRTNPDTFYFSYATEQTAEGLFGGYHHPEFWMNPFLFPTAFYMGRASYAHPFYPEFRASDWWHNDGLVSVYSQLYPRISGNHPVGGPISDLSSTSPGRWYHEIVEHTDHGDIVLFPEPDQIKPQRRFYRRLFDRLSEL
ncbi:MAG TPA: hypothetical protein VN634_11175 [Candidatus Limnocylindrales bacterium]|nr:hypothetical protein [Candidatus Limnocylindrales bacterium]